MSVSVTEAAAIGNRAVNNDGPAMVLLPGKTEAGHEPAPDEQAFKTARDEGYSAGYAQAMRDLRRVADDRRHLTYRHRVARAVRGLRPRPHPLGTRVHRVRRLSAVVLRRRFADCLPAPCCEREYVYRLPSRPGQVCCPDCGQGYLAR